MAYNFFPTKSAEIIKKLKNDSDKVSEIDNLFKYCRKTFKDIPTPINIDPAKLHTVNVTRALQGSLDLRRAISEAKLKSIKIKFGNGSSGNRGVNNRGNLFEGIFAGAIRTLWNGDEVRDPQIAKAVEHLAKTYNFTKLKDLEVVEEGAQNTARPLKFTPGPFISSPTNSLNIGKTVTDLTLRSKGKDIAYLSLKLGNTTTFFNIGIKTILTPTEIKTGTIKNQAGLKLLKMFGIDSETFCKIFNGKLSRGQVVNTWSKVNKAYLEKFIQSGMGYGFHVIHKLSNEVKSTKIDQSYMTAASRPKSCTVYYGGKTGTGKRIDMEIITGKYRMKFNIRDTQGGDGYPTRIMGDFTYL
tara:strand:+ start:146 stop:1210 length:1065 start_codon:yes stop_codon:yes gene_type:complete